MPDRIATKPAGEDTQIGNHVTNAYLKFFHKYLGYLGTTGLNSVRNSLCEIWGSSGENLDYWVLGYEAL
jgi:hypothetical protein